jgi:aryl-alcohol dehydrogenase-like predicted oxidoreductase
MLNRYIEKEVIPVGASRPSQVEENVKAVEIELTSEVIEKIEGILA